MKEIQISDELDVKLRELADRITAITGKETTTEDALSAEVQKKAEENKGFAQETLEMLLSGLIRDCNDFLDSKQNPQDTNQPNI